jgi:hypothetical protein
MTQDIKRKKDKTTKIKSRDFSLNFEMLVSDSGLTTRMSRHLKKYKIQGHSGERRTKHTRRDARRLKEKEEKKRKEKEEKKRMEKGDLGYNTD